MKILLAEDNLLQREALELLLQEWDFDVVSVADGARAWEVLQQPDAPPLAILDWQMPHLSGPEVCRRVRAQVPPHHRHLILLTASSSGLDLQQGLEAGADDYVRKPFDELELQARVRAGVRSITLEIQLAQRFEELQEATKRIRTLEGILSICSYCRKIRDDGDRWRTVEDYISEKSRAKFSHGICPHCYSTVVAEQLRTLDPGGPPA